jgi:putative methyltransferase (TIGR04325 family)
MNTKMKSVVRASLPAPVLRWWRRRFGWQWFRGDYSTWAEARSASRGYDSAAILAQVREAAHAVRDGRAAWDRDGMTFATPATNAPLLETLRNVAASANGCLDLIDFGGALGSTWRQYRSELADLATVRWRVVEQPGFVAAGRDLTDSVLSFHPSLDDAVGAGARPAAVLFSSVLPYVEHPGKLLEEVVQREFQHIIIDRTPFIAGGRTRLVVQHTPLQLGGASYPCWLFDRRQLVEAVGATYRLVREWAALDELAADVEHRGFHFQRST